MTISIYIHAFISSLTLVLFPLASEAGARQDTSGLYAIYTRAYKYICVLVLFLVLTAAVGSWQLLSNWMGVDFANHAAGVLTTQALVFGLMALLVVPWQIADGLGYPWLSALLSLWWLMSTVMLAVFLTPRYGIQGMAYSRLLAMTVTPIFILIVERIAFGRCLWEFWRRTCLALIVAGSLTGATQYLLFKNLPHGWFWFLLAVSVSGIVYALMLLATRYMDDAEQKWLRSFVARVVVN
jgi:O-antigen/teichoic acid export membrane protein